MSGAVIAAVVCLLALLLLIHRTVVSKRTYGVVLDLSAEEAAAIVEAHFPRVTWVKTTGPGLINRARVNNSNRMLIVSIDVREHEECAEVRAWVSNRRSIAGLTVAVGALKALQIRNRLRRHPACLRDAD
ncbi:hypothetical protein [Brevibacterium renqingii]|uniref:hypothetical protein n=1 Tax=Brevibacterium renqingii TaxID=2776916 RepID=UPI001AE0C4CD|nr:hypothetical protein [Brevibacterium renqingii]